MFLLGGGADTGGGSSRAPGWPDGAGVVPAALRTRSRSSGRFLGAGDLIISRRSTGSWLFFDESVKHSNNNSQKSKTLHPTGRRGVGDLGQQRAEVMLGLCQALLSCGTFGFVFFVLFCFVFSPPHSVSEHVGFTVGAETFRRAPKGMFTMCRDNRGFTASSLDCGWGRSGRIYIQAGFISSSPHCT